MAGYSNVPGLAGYLGMEQAIQGRQQAALQQQGLMAQLAANKQKLDEEAQIKGVMANSPTPEMAIANLTRLGPHGVAAATQIAQLGEHQAKLDTARALASAPPGSMEDPAFLDKLALKDPRYETLANKAREKQAAAAQLKSMRGTAETIQPDPQEAQQTADQGTPTVPAVTQYKGGIFDALTQSENPQIAAQATQLKGALEKAGPSIPPQYWQGLQKQLSDKETALLNRPERPAEPLHPIVGPDGKPVLVSRSDAIGKTPYVASQAGAGLLEPETLKTIAEQYLAGDRKAIEGYGRNAQAKAALANEINKQARAKGWSGADIAAQMADFAGTLAGSTAVGKRAAAITLAATEAEQMIPVAEAASKKFDRTSFVPANIALKAYQENTGAPEVKAFGAALNSLVNIYARAINPNGVGTVSDKEHAREMISTINSPEQFAAVMGIIRQELKIAKEAPRTVQEATRERVSPKAPSAAPETPTQAPAAIPEFASERDIPPGFKGRAKVGGKIGTVN